MSNNKSTRHNGITQTTAMMPAGTEWPNRLLPDQWATILAAPTNTTTCADSTTAQVPTMDCVAALSNQMPTTSTASLQSVQQDDIKADIMIDSGAATHVCPPWFAQHTHVPNTTWTRTAAEDSNRRKHSSVWIQMGLDDQHQQAAPCCPLLCVWSYKTHHVSNKTGRTRVQHTAEWHTNSHTRKGIQHSTCSTWWTLLHDDGACQHSSQHATGNTSNYPRHNSTDHTCHLDTNRYGGLEEQKWPLDTHGPRISGQSAQDATQSTRCTRSTVSSSNRKVGQLQKKNCQKKQWQQWEHWGSISDTRHETTKENPQRRTLDRRNIVQGEGRNTSPWQRTANASTTRNQDDSPSSSQSSTSTSSRTSNGKDETHNKAATLWSNSNWINILATPKVSTTNSRLLDQRRTLVEKLRHDLYIPQQTDDGPDVTRLTTDRTTMVRPTSGARWYMIDDDWTAQRQSTLNREWTGSTNFEETTASRMTHTYDVDEQQEARRAKGLPAPQQPTAQERLEYELTHLPYLSWSPVCVQAKGRSDNHPEQHNKAPVVQCDSSIINFHSHGCRNRHVHGSTYRRQNTKHAISVNMPSTIPDGMWQGTCSAQQHCFAVRQWGFPHSTAQSNSYSNGKQHSSTTITSIHFTSTRQRGTCPSNIDWTSESAQATAWKQLQHTIDKQASHHAMDGETCSLPIEQVCNPRRWQYQLLQALEQGTQDTNLWIWWNSSWNVANSKTNAEDGSQILSQQGGQIKDH